MIAALLVGALAVSAFLWFAGWDRSDSAQLALGQQIYAEHCAACHGASLEGQPNWQATLPNGKMPAPPLDTSGHAWHHSEAELFRVVKEGMAAVERGRASDMPAFGDVLTDDQIRAVIAFIQSTW